MSPLEDYMPPDPQAFKVEFHHLEASFCEDQVSKSDPQSEVQDLDVALVPEALHPMRQASSNLSIQSAHGTETAHGNDINTRSPPIKCCSGTVEAQLDFQNTSYNDGNKDQSPTHEPSDFDQEYSPGPESYVAPDKDILLCFYCDQPLRTPCSANIKKLFESTLPKTHPAPRLTNPSGRIGPWEAMFMVCEAHRAEDIVIPQGVQQGWPTIIDFNLLPSRVRKLRPKLCIMVEAPLQNCPLLRRIHKALKKGRIGRQIMTSSFARFEHGYYGAQGFLIVLKSLRNMFPQFASQQPIANLATSVFLEHVLGPQTICMLIRDDLRLSSDASFRTLYRTLTSSWAFGDVLHPDEPSTKLVGAAEASQSNWEDDIGPEMRARLRVGRKRLEKDFEEAGIDLDYACQVLGISSSAGDPSV